MPETILLIRDKFENDFGFLEENAAAQDVDQITNGLTSIVATHQPETVYTWGGKKRGLCGVRRHL